MYISGLVFCRNVSLSFYIYTYIYMYIYVYIYGFVMRERRTKTVVIIYIYEYCCLINFSYKNWPSIFHDTIMHAHFYYLYSVSHSVLY